MGLNKTMEEQLHECKIRIDEIAPHFCVAKWLQVTLHLHLGQNHSCHHPGTHPIPRECEQNPSLLHNTPFKKDIWKKIMDGETIDECRYCNNCEDENNRFSDRILKSNESWAKPYIQSIVDNPLLDRNPTYVEVNFSHICNCQCAYCSPWISSSWHDDVNKNGHYNTSAKFGKLDKYKTPIEGRNIYKEAFWKWWPELVDNLHYFRITGGEPLLHKETFMIMDSLLENPKQHLDFSINTNLCVNEKLIDKFLLKAEELVKNKCVKKFTVYTSCESYGKTAEYYRWGLDYKYWWKNVDRVLEIDDIQCIIMSTYNLLSVTTFIDFLRDVYKRKQIYDYKIILDVPYLRNPEFLCANILTSDFLEYMEQCISYMYSKTGEHGTKYGFMKFEYAKFERIFNTLKNRMNDISYEIPKRDFYKFINEWDRRKGLNFLEVFPEYEEFYKLCERETKNEPS